MNTESTNSSLVKFDGQALMNAYQKWAPNVNMTKAEVEKGVQTMMEGLCIFFETHRIGNVAHI